MAQYCDDFILSEEIDQFGLDDTSDSFETWMGLRGPQGIQGPAGQGFVIKGIVATVGDLPPSPADESIYLVGASAPYNAYIYTNGSWVDLGGVAVGPAGPGVTTGGSTAQVLKKASATDYDTTWGEVDTVSLADGAVKNIKIYDGAVTVNKLDTDSVSTAKIVDLNVTTAKIADLNVTTAKIADEAVSANKLQGGLLYHENLLDNWYFSGGGQGSYFPINQRGQLTYSGSGYGIDRWKASSSYNEVTINSTNVGFTNTHPSSRTYFQQTFSNPADFLGKTVTGSILVVENGSLVLYSGTQTIPSSFPASNTYPDFVETSTGILRLLVGTSEIGMVLTVNSSSTVNVVAMKLELGTNQTLAHQSNGTWELVDIPIHATELMKCRRYFRRYSEFYDIFNGFLASSSKRLFVGTPDSSKMATENPSVTVSGGLLIRGVAGSISSPSSGIIAENNTAESFGTAVVFVKSDNSAWDGTNNTVVALSAGTGQTIDFSSEP